MIDVQDLTKQYAGRTAVNHISFHVEPGEVVGFLGPNGAGKSTTMRILSGYMPATSGHATVAGFDVFHQSIQVRQSVGYMPEMAPLYTDMKVKEYLAFRAQLKGLSGASMRRRIGEVMDLTGVTDMRRRLIGNLSKGYRQRVALADALVHKPKLLILDEPTNGLDPVQIRHVRDLLRSLKSKHTVLLSTHILQEVEQSCDRVVMIHQGRIRANDTPQNLARQLRSTTLLHLELSGSGNLAAELAAIPGVRKANEDAGDSTPWRRFTLRVEPEHDVRDAVMDLATKKNWRIREMHRQLPTLEDVFVELSMNAGTPGDIPTHVL
ncbi:MAG: ATP-binding cassette domain-containing protein [Prosthecobacter sp.]|jgi:ABC-2 type transport system ATP-binding protein|uniref:ABC transporter ATP-binding protein n=1 Tax=Prosthecobacter sp. TaxID=1965333 RepID=UPI0019E18FD8|nr:ATP-binding cassette domain-containing protein [Prosthecobacter sp.]MBE2282516.1 ATP-binding cassette domain-containing protein [Prosthecobacter sp.]